MSTLLLLVTLAATPAPQQAPPAANWWVRDYVNYQDGAGYSANHRPERSVRGTYFHVDMNPLPPGWGEQAALEAPSYRDAVHGAGFGLVLLVMALVPVGSAVVFLRPRGLSWTRGSQRISRAEAREMLGRL